MTNQHPKDPKDHCECNNVGTLRSEFLTGWYDPETELPFVDHQPGECRCTNELKLYKRGNEIVTLCSNCHTFEDKEILSMTNQERTVAKLAAMMIGSSRTPEVYNAAEGLVKFFQEKSIDPSIAIAAMAVMLGTIIGNISSSKETSDDIIASLTAAITIFTDNTVGSK